MNMHKSAPTRGKWSTLLLTMAALAFISKMDAQTVYLNFSGGGGSPFVVTWSAPITYRLTESTSNSGVNPYFDFQAIANIGTAVPVDTVAPIPGGGPTYTSTGAGSGDGLQTINSFYVSPIVHGVVSTDDLVFRATADTAATFLTVGDVITLSAGSLHNSTPYNGVMPVSGYYNTFITDASYQTDLGSGVSAIPETSTYAAWAGLAALGLAWARRPKAAASQA